MRVSPPAGQIGGASFGALCRIDASIDTSVGLCSIGAISRGRGVRSVTFARYTYAYRKIRSWHVDVLRSAWLALRYWLSGDTGRFSSHGGWRVSRLHRKDEED
jgi:hypothetical protein